MARKGAETLNGVKAGEAGALAETVLSAHLPQTSVWSLERGAEAVGLGTMSTGLEIERKEEVCGDAAPVRETGMKLRRVWALSQCYACLLCLPSLAGAHWPLGAPTTQKRRYF